MVINYPLCCPTRNPNTCVICQQILQSVLSFDRYKKQIKLYRFFVPFYEDVPYIILKIESTLLFVS